MIWKVRASRGSMKKTASGDSKQLVIQLPTGWIRDALSSSALPSVLFLFSLLVKARPEHIFCLKHSCSGAALLLFIQSSAKQSFEHKHEVNVAGSLSQEEGGNGVLLHSRV